MGYVEKEKYNEYQRNWREKNIDRAREINRKSEKREERKEYRKKWWSENPKAKLIKERFKESHPNIQKEYDKNFKEKHPERLRKKYEKYYNSIKGIINRLKKADKKRFGIENKNITIELITELDRKYIICPYCGNEFKPRFEYDHINPFKPFSRYNIVRACDKCNKDKSRADMMQWMSFKKLKVSEKLEELYKKAYKWEIILNYS